MNWQDIIHNSELVYTSIPEDKGFRNWSLKKTTCNVSFYETYPIEDIDRIICGILDSNNGSLEENKIATILGFNVVDNFDITPKRYADKAELDIFKAIVKPVFDWGLITKEKESNTYRLTELGSRALETGDKYRFYSGKKILFENFGIKSQRDNDSLFFPYYSALGLFSEITNRIPIKYEDIKLTEVFNIEESNLIKRHRLQSKDIYQIYKSETTVYFEITSCDVDIKLFKQDEEYYPIIFYKNQISTEATELLYKPGNANLKEKKIEWGLYLKLIKDPNAVLDYKTISPFEDLLELDSLVKDTRLVWQDKQLFTFIAEKANTNQWHTISNQCPIEVIKSHIEKYVDKWDWTSLSLLIDNSFLIENATKYPWNFEAISAKEDIAVDVLKILLLIPELKEQDWDWDNIMPQLGFDFIESNIDKIDFDLSELTKTNINDVQRLISEYPDKKWNWLYISTEYELSFILDNILKFKQYLQIKNVINRAFSSEEYVSLFSNSDNLKSVLAELKETSLRNYSPNHSNYVWNAELIDFLEATNYLTWASGTHTIGFECNPYVNWEYDYFKKYHSKIVTDKGYSFVSKKVEDANIILDYLEWNWDWNAISSNANLIRNIDFVLIIANKLNFSLLLQYIDGKILEVLFEKSDILTFLEHSPENWRPVTEKVTIEFVRQYINYNWDWEVLTKRFCSFIKIEALGNPKWIEKWDWKYLTRNLDLAKIYDNLDLYVNYWDWEYLTEKLDKSFILDNLPEYNDYWDWNLLLCKQLEKQDLSFSTNLLQIATCISVFDKELQKDLWKVITHKFDYEELEQLIEQTCSTNYIDLFKWDYAYFYSLPAFNLRNYLEHYTNCINWEKLSCCKKLNSELFFDKKFFDYKTWINDVFRILGNSDYLWDFKELSKNNNINWCDDVLEQYITLWDWEYLSLYSSCFKQDENQILRLSKFQNYIDFSKFSERNDNSISEYLIRKFIKYEWDWQILSQNPTIQYSAKFLLENANKDWDWAALSDKKIKDFNNETLLQLIDKKWDWNLLSERNDIEFSKKIDDKYFIEMLIDKPLNWETISKRTDIVFSETMITLLRDKPLNWEIVSRNQSFVPNSKTLSVLKGETLDWSAISKNENISAEILWDYKDNLNWECLTKNKQFDISDTELLFKYQNFVDWKFVSQSDKFKITTDNLKHFKEKLHWPTINSRKDFVISEDLFPPFADVLNWSNVSKSMEIHFTEELIEKYRNYWDWQLLRKNPQVIEQLETTLGKYKSEFNAVEFLEQFDRTPYIYHFTHLFNAIDIIKDRKILSRHKAEGKFANAAGNLVARRDTAHNFARFYYRPQTPTQFYNECLGMDSQSGYLKTWRYWDGSWVECSKWKTYYPQAYNLGLPKCPIPVFFKFDLKEVLMKISDKCYYSTGNMQTNWAKVERVCENPNAINTTHLYSDASDYDNYKQYSQQEFLVLEEFDFSKLDSFEIICYNEEYANLLKLHLGDDPICEKINSNSWGIFHRGNRELYINETDNEISISSEYRDNAYLSIKGEGLKYIQVLNSDNIQKETATEIIAYPEIKFTKTERPIEVHFVDTSTANTRDWVVYKN